MWNLCAAQHSLIRGVCRCIYFVFDLHQDAELIRDSRLLIQSKYGRHVTRIREHPFFALAIYVCSKCIYGCALGGLFEARSLSRQVQRRALME